jgi:hypothetical protein
MLVGGEATRGGPPAAGTRQGQPRSLCRTARGGAGPLPGGRGVRAPEAGRSGLACDGPAITRGGPGPPRGGRVRRGYPRALPPTWLCRDPGPHRARGRVRRPRSQLSGPEAVCHVTQRRGGAWIMRSQRPGRPSGRYLYLYVPTNTNQFPEVGGAPTRPYKYFSNWLRKFN